MATTTPNFGWSVPTSTDLVKDGATAIELLGDSIDASLVDLKGGTTGQVLSKASNADMDFTWVTDAAGDITGVTAGTGISGGGTSGTVTVTNSMATAIDAKGDLIGGTGADTFARLAVGANGTILTADSAEATGLKWVASSAGKVLQIVTVATATKTTTTSTSFVDATNLTATITPTSASSKILVMVNNHIGYSGAVKGPGWKEQIVRGSTAIYDFSNNYSYGDAWTGSNAFGQIISLIYVDSPATTSATTYKVQISALASTTVELNQNATDEATITLMEITT